jgi:DNA-binding CsgD family transcriptional regulator
MREFPRAAIRVVSGERLLGEVVADALRVLIADRGTVAFVDRSTVAAEPQQTGGLVIDLEGVDISISIDRGDGGRQRDATWVSAKVVSLQELVRLARSGAGVTAFPPSTRERQNGSHGPGGGRLTDRELEVLGEMRRGAANTTIAASLDISVHTVRSHVGSIMRKLGTSTRVEAITRSR